MILSNNSSKPFNEYLPPVVRSTLDAGPLCSHWALAISSFFSHERSNPHMKSKLELVCKDMAEQIFEQIDAKEPLSLIKLINLVKANLSNEDKLCRAALILIARDLFHSSLQPNSFYPGHAFFLIIDSHEHSKELNDALLDSWPTLQENKNPSEVFAIISQSIERMDPKSQLQFLTNYVNVCPPTAPEFQSICFRQTQSKLARAADIMSAETAPKFQPMRLSELISNESYMLLNQFFAPTNIDALLSYHKEKKPAVARRKAIKALVIAFTDHLDLTNPTSLMSYIPNALHNYSLKGRLDLKNHPKSEISRNNIALAREFTKTALERSDQSPEYLTQIYFFLFYFAPAGSGYGIVNKQQLKEAILHQLLILGENNRAPFSEEDYLSCFPADFREELEYELSATARKAERVAESSAPPLGSDPLAHFDIRPLMALIHNEYIKGRMRNPVLDLSSLRKACVETSKNLLELIDVQKPSSLSQNFFQLIAKLETAITPSLPSENAILQIPTVLKSELAKLLFQECLGRSDAYLDQAYYMVFSIVTAALLDCTGRSNATFYMAFSATIEDSLKHCLIQKLTNQKQLQLAIYKQIITLAVLGDSSATELIQIKCYNALKSVRIRHCLELLPPDFFSASQMAYCKKALSNLDSPSLPSEFYPISKDENTKTPPTQQPRPTRKSTKKTNISRIDTSLQASSSGNLVPSPSSSRTVASPAKTPVINPIPKEPRLPKRLKPASQPIQAASIILEPLFIPATAPALSMDNLVSRLEIVDADTYEKLRKDIKKFPKKERLVFYEKTAAILVEKKHPLALAIISRKFKDSNKRDTLLLKIVSSYRNTKIREKALESIFDKQLKEMASTLHLAALQQRNSYTRESVVQRPTLLRQTSMFLPRIASADSSNIAEPSSSNSRSRSNSAAVQGSGHDPFSNQDRRFYCPSHEFKGQTFSYGNLRGIIQAEAEKYGFISSWADGHGDHKLLKLFSEEGIPRDCDCSIPHHVDMKEGVARTYTLNALASVRKAADKLGLWKPASE